MRLRNQFHTDRGFALVEILLALLIVSIVAAIVVMAVARPAEDSAGKCRLDASKFGAAVSQHHEREQKWPSAGPKGDPSVLAVLLLLQARGDLPRSGDPLRYLDGSQRPAIDATKGWTYDFKTHTTNDANCG